MYTLIFITIVLLNLVITYYLLPFTSSYFFGEINQGLITEERAGIDNELKPFARKINETKRRGLREGATLVEVVC